MREIRSMDDDMKLHDGSPLDGMKWHEKLIVIGLYIIIVVPAIILDWVHSKKTKHDRKRTDTR